MATILSACRTVGVIAGHTSAVGAILYPALLEKGYNRKFALGALTSGGTLGVVIPPSIPMILRHRYGKIDQRSVPGRHHPGHPADHRAGQLLVNPKSSHAEPAVRHAVADNHVEARIFALMTPVILLGGIYTGYFSATEAAALRLIRDAGGGVHSSRVEVAGLLRHRGRDLKAVWRVVPHRRDRTQHQPAADHGTGTTGPVEWMTSTVSDKFLFLLLLNVFLLLIGCLIDIGAAILMLAPILLPVAMAYGVDPIHFGVIMVVNLKSAS